GYLSSTSAAVAQTDRNQFSGFAAAQREPDQKPPGGVEFCFSRAPSGDRQFWGWAATFHRVQEQAACLSRVTDCSAELVTRSSRAAIVTGQTDDSGRPDFSFGPGAKQNAIVVRSH